ncbi:MAG TPA: phosphatase PAP2 family protein [Propionibacteriaceae bacterium]
MRLDDDQPSDASIGDRDLTRWRSRLGHGLVGLARRLARTFSADSVLYVTSAIGGVVVVALLVVGGQIYEAVEEGDGIAGFDRPVLDAALSLRTATNTRVLTVFTHLGGPVGMTIIATAITVLMVWRWRSRTPLFLMLLAVAGSLTMTNVGKAIVGRARPPLADAVPPYEYAFSFPSGHALNSTVISGMVAYLVMAHLRTRIARAGAVLAAVVWSVSMGLSRVFLGHHWLTDVMFAWVIGLAWIGVLVTAHRLFLTVRRRRREEPQSAQELVD